LGAKVVKKAITSSFFYKKLFPTV